MPTWKFAVKGGPRAGGKLRRLFDSLDNIEAVSPQIHRTLLDWQQEVWQSQGSVINEPWPQYSGKEDIYAMIKSSIIASEGGSMVTSPGPELRWAKGEEQLFPSLTSENRKGHVWEEKSGGKDGWIFGTQVPHAAKHQRGQGTVPKKLGGPFGIKQRMFLKATDDVAARLKNEILEFMDA